MDSHQVIISPVVTERSLADQEKGKYTFVVDSRATKDQIAQAFKTVFNIKPLAVNTVCIKGKEKTNWKTRKPIQRSDRKKAIVSIPKDKKIEILQLKEQKK